MSGEWLYALAVVAAYMIGRKNEWIVPRLTRFINRLGGDRG